MSDETEAKTAIEALNGSEFMGVKITVEASRSKVRPKPGMGGKGQCYRCGKSGHWSKECPRNSHDRYNYNGCVLSAIIFNLFTHFQSLPKNITCAFYLSKSDTVLFLNTFLLVFDSHFRDPGFVIVF